MFARALTERKSDFAGIKKDYIDSISIEKGNIEKSKYDYKSHTKQLSIPILNGFKFYKDYTNGIFNFKIYVCDLIIQGKVLRQFISYFVEPKLQDFYQLTVSVGPFDFPTNQIKIDQIDLNNDSTTKSLDILNTLLLNNLKYKE